MVMPGDPDATQPFPTTGPAGGPPGPPGPPIPPRHDDDDRRRLWIWALLALLIGVGVGVGIALVVSGDDDTGGGSTTTSSTSTTTSSTTTSSTTTTTAPPTTTTTAALAPPGPVTGVSAGPGGGSGEVTVQWNPTAGATSYRLYRSATAGSTGGVQANVTTTNYTDLPGGPAYYKVSAVNAGGVEGPLSAQVCGAPVAMSCP